MKTPQMPSGLKTQLRHSFAFGDVDGVVELNRLWFEYIKELRKIAQEGEGINEEV